MVVREPYSRIVSEFHCTYGGVGAKASQYNVSTFNNYIMKEIQHFHEKGWKMPGKPGHWGKLHESLMPDYTRCVILRYAIVARETVEKCLSMYVCVYVCVCVYV